jgi:hypothetical protein
MAMLMRVLLPPGLIVGSSGPPLPSAGQAPIAKQIITAKVIIPNSLNVLFIQYSLFIYKPQK